MSLIVRILAIACVLVVPAFAVAGCGGDDDAKKAKSASEESASDDDVAGGDEEPPSVSGSVDGLPPDPPDVDAPSDGEDGAVNRSAKVLSVTVEDGFPVGGPQRWSVSKGDAVTIVVEGADEGVHLHGYDIEAEPNAKGRAVITLDAASDEGSFEVELEGSGTLIGTLLVK